MFAARGNVRALDRARRLAATSLSSRSVRWASALAWLRLPRRTRWAIRGRGEPRLGADPGDGEQPRDGHRAVQRRRLRLQQTMGRIHENEVRLSAARVNLKNAHHALNISLISAYKNPQPDPLQAALEARNFGQVLEQFALLDRAQSYNASILTDIRDYRRRSTRASACSTASAIPGAKRSPS